MNTRGAQPLFDPVLSPGHGGLRPRAIDDDVDNAKSPWARLSAGQSVGAQTNIQYDASETELQSAMTNLFELRGSDADAMQLQVTLASPAAIPRSAAQVAATLDRANATGALVNAEMGGGFYPGLAHSIIWPPISALVRWGVGGARFEAIVDYVNGTVINVPASTLDVLPIITPDAANQPGTSGLYNLKGLVHPGLPRASAARRTIQIGVLTLDEESSVFATPAFASRVTVFGCDQSPNVVPGVTVAYLRFWQDPQGTVNIGNFLVNGNQPVSFEVPNGGAYFTIVSQTSPATAGQDVTFGACFNLAI